MSKNIRSFLIGSSLPAFFISALYIGQGHARANRPSDIPYEWMPIVIPLLYGIWNVAIVNVQQRYSTARVWRWWIPFVMGAMFGVGLSLFGRFGGYDFPQRYFGFTKSNEHYIHLYASVLYALIFGFVLQYLNKFSSIPLPH